MCKCFEIYPYHKSQIADWDGEKWICKIHKEIVEVSNDREN